MDLLLFEIEELAYAVAVAELARIEDNPGKGGPRFGPWQRELGRRGKRRPKATFDKLLRLRSGVAEVVLYIDELGDIVAATPEELSPFPTQASRAPTAYFRGVVEIHGRPRIVLNPAAFDSEEGDA